MDGRIAAFVSAGTLFVECLSFPDKLTYLSVAGTPAPRPKPDPRMVAMFDDLASIGVRLLRAPLIAAEKFVDSLEWADDVVYPIEQRQDRFGNFVQPLPRHRPLVAYGETLLSSQPPIPAPPFIKTGENSWSVATPARWAIAIKREYDGNPQGRKALEKIVRPAISEWCDALIVGSHYAYGNDVFGTIDHGRNAGSGSILHHGNRMNLTSQGIVLMTPRELVAHFTL